MRAARVRHIFYLGRDSSKAGFWVTGNEGALLRVRRAVLRRDRKGRGWVDR